MTNMCLNGGWNREQVIAIDNVGSHFALPAFARFDALPKPAVTCDALKVAYKSVRVEGTTGIILCKGLLVFWLEHEQVPLVAVVQVIRPATSVERKFGLDSCMKTISYVL